MLRISLRRDARRGAAAVESALVLGVFLFLLFGMFEYCRFLMVMHVTTNAARDGARYAIVNVDKPSDFDTTDYTDAAGQKYDSIQKYTTVRMGGVQKNIEGYRVACFAVDQGGLVQSPPMIRPKARSTSGGSYPDPFNASDSNAVPWNTATFTEKIAVTIDGNYRPLLPTFLMMPDSISIKTTAIMGSEG